ncbi:nitrate- and nitrite sensing domain-containing protein [Marinobacter litoralis]|uniref:nitrate- and nitrite sensing domain-containing protein n=1 Tax=Marinobacter litoralis TaxID=187981 RepID=UPI002A0A54E5|nr:nitrate- and nitrite sensing domain-containing protein [Marinobacter litoralis]
MSKKAGSASPQAATAADFLIASRQCEVRSLEYFLLMGRLVQSSGHLIHELQRERGVTSLFLGSEGLRFADERASIMVQTNEQAHLFDQALHDIQHELISHPVSSPLLGHIASALHGLGQLDGIRRQVEEQNITVSEAVDWFCNTIHQLITVVCEAADTVVEPSIAGLLVALVQVMTGKEYCGQERAAGSTGFARGCFDRALSRRMMHLVEAQDRCFDVFFDHAPEDSLALWQQLRGHPREPEIDRMRQIAVSVGPYKSLDPELAQRWFALMTERMDAIKQIEDCVESAFHQRCVERYGEARRSLADQASLLASLEQGVQSNRSILDLIQEQNRRLQQMSEELQSAKEALEERRVQEKAVLLLMQHRKIDNDEAHRVLRKLAMDQGKRLPEVARALLAMADVLN